MNSLTIGNESASRRPPLRKFGSACVEKIVIRPVKIRIKHFQGDREESLTSPPGEFEGDKR